MYLSEGHHSHHRDSAREVVPLLGGPLDESGAVFGEDPTLLDEGVGGLGELREVGFAAGVALGDGFARVVGFFAGGGVFWKREEGAFERETLGRSADRRVA